MNELKGLAEEYLGADIPQELFGMVLPAAQRKLEWIISREGDADGQRLKPRYIAQLISEEIRAELLEYQCQKHYEDKKEPPKNWTALYHNLIIAQLTQVCQEQ